MRTIERTSQFKKDYKRECKGQHRLTVETDLIIVLKQLIADRPLAAKYKDHPFSNISGTAPHVPITVLPP